MLEAIAREFAEGRPLLIGTTSLDTQRPEIWNIAAIAASGHPNALELFRRIMLATAAVPAAFPPVMIDVALDGRRYQEMHVDGGEIAQLFLCPPTINVRELLQRVGLVRERHAFSIRNARLDADWAAVERRTLGIAGRAISTMIHVSGMNDQLRIDFTTQRDGVGYDLAYVGADFTAPRTKDFDPDFMRALFDFGYRKGRQDYPWSKAPPFLEARHVQ